MNIVQRALRSIIGKSTEPKNIFQSLFNSFFTPTWARRDYYYGIVYKCIDVIATNVSTIDYGLYQQKVNTDDLDPKNDHPAFKLLTRPNKFQTGVDLLYLISSHLETAGRAYIYMVRPGEGMSKGDPTELWVLDPTRIKISRKDNAYISGYTYRNPQGTEIPFDVDEILPIMRPNPYDQQAGVSTIEMARYEIEGDLNATVWNKNFFANGAIPTGTLTTPAEISIEAYNRIKEQWYRQYAGAKNAHKPLVLEAGLTYNQISPKQKDMDFIEQRRFNRDEIMAIFGVHKAILGITEDVNRANAETSEYVFAKRTIKPRLDLIFEKLNHGYIPMFKNSENLALIFENPVPEDEEMKLRRLESATNRYMTINEARAEDGLEPLEGGDILYVSALNIPLGQEVDQQDVEKSVFNQGVKALKKQTRASKYSRNRERYLNVREKQYGLKIQQEFKTFLKDIKKQPVKSYDLKKKGIAEEIAVVLIPNNSDFTKLLSSITIKFAIEAAEKGRDIAGEAFKMPIDFSLKNTNAIEQLTRRSEEVANLAEDTLQNRAREIIARNLNNDVVDIVTIKAEILETLDSELEWRAERIARTELVNAFNEGSVETYRNSGVVEKIQWITADDDRVDDTCQMNNGQTTSLNGVFLSGDALPPVHPNCRCEVIPYFGD